MEVCLHELGKIKHKQSEEWRNMSEGKKNL
jgi:hypothetical protein